MRYNLTAAAYRTTWSATGGLVPLSDSDSISTDCFVSSAAVTLRSHCSGRRRSPPVVGGASQGHCGGFPRIMRPRKSLGQVFGRVIPLPHASLAVIFMGTGRLRWRDRGLDVPTHRIQSCSSPPVLIHLIHCPSGPFPKIPWFCFRADCSRRSQLNDSPDDTTSLPKEAPPRLSPSWIHHALAVPSRPHASL